MKVLSSNIQLRDGAKLPDNLPERTLRSILCTQLHTKKHVRTTYKAKPRRVNDDEVMAELARLIN